MQRARLMLHEVTRYPADGSEDRLSFVAGVNAICGRPNTGKTEWLKMIDFLFGKRGTAENSLSEGLSLKYDEVHADISINGEAVHLERRWKERGSRTSVFLNGEKLDANGFSEAILNMLGIPVLHYPQGDPYGSRSWPLLGWRSLLRHIYRRQEYWSDIADEQPDSEQHACIMQFLGAAQHVFSDEYGEMVTNEKEIRRLKTMREQFIDLLQQISAELMSEDELGVGLTPQSIADAITRLRQHIDQLATRRQAVLAGMHSDMQSQTPPSPSRPEELGRELVAVQTQGDERLMELEGTRQRLREIAEYGTAAQAELARLERAEVAGGVLSGLRITHCPACDREIHDVTRGSCCLCKRPLQEDGTGTTEAEHRIAFEKRQLQSEIQEAADLANVLRQDEERLVSLVQALGTRASEIETALQPVRSAAAATAIPQEVQVIDVETGRLHERIRQLERVAGVLDRREAIADEIAVLTRRVAELEAEVARQAAAVSYETSGDKLSDGMMEYLAQINQARPNMWSQGYVSVDLHQRDFDMRVGNRHWGNRLGGTLRLYFLLSYHYALLRLSVDEDCHYPGLVILDFPPQLDDGTLIGDQENFVLEPFIGLTARQGMEATQVIVAGNAFEGLEGAHMTELSRVWS